MLTIGVVAILRHLMLLVGVAHQREARQGVLVGDMDDLVQATIACSRRSR